MEKIAFILVLIPILLFFVQCYYIVNYFKTFVDEYFDGCVKSWVPKRDRIVFFGSITFLIFSLYLLVKILNYKSGNLYYFIFYFLGVFIFTFLIYILIKNVRDKKNKCVKKIKKKLVVLDNNYKVIDERYLKKIYLLFRQNEYIDDNFKEEDFVQNFLQKPITLNLSVPSFRYFYNFLISNFKIKIKPSKFCKLFINKYNKKYNIKQFSKSQTPIPKNYKEMNKVFEEILKK